MHIRQYSTITSKEKTVERRDSWSKEDEEVLVRLVLKHIESGSTQTNAFLEAEEKLGRTKSACGFRWNNKLRIIYEERIRETKLSNRVKARAKKIRYGAKSTWSLEQDKAILKFVLDGIYIGRKIRDSIQLAAAYLDKKENSCMIRWTTVVRPDNLSEFLEAKKRYKEQMESSKDPCDENRFGQVIHNLEEKIIELAKEVRYMKENYVEKNDPRCFNVIRKQEEI